MKHHNTNKLKTQSGIGHLTGQRNNSQQTRRRQQSGGHRSNAKNSEETSCRKNTHQNQTLSRSGNNKEAQNRSSYPHNSPDITNNRGRNDTTKGKIHSTHSNTPQTQAINTMRRFKHIQIQIQYIYTQVRKLSSQKYVDQSNKVGSDRRQIGHPGNNTR